MYYSQITKKFRDEPLPHHGFLRSREFEMKGIKYCMPWMVLNLKYSIDIRNDLLYIIVCHYIFYTEISVHLFQSIF